jgi:anthranilate 1,2-dioxygenase (deaminating, decarboxylating) large subunit
VNGYYFKQLTDTRFNGSSVPGTKEQVLGIGPGAVFRFNKHASFFFNAYFETAVENRSKGVRLNSLFAFHF